MTVQNNQTIWDDDHYWKEYDDQTEREYNELLEQESQYVQNEETR